MTNLKLIYKLTALIGIFGIISISFSLIMAINMLSICFGSLMACLILLLQEKK